MKNDIVIEDINLALISRYRNLNSPWFGWVEEAYRANPYKSIIDEMLHCDTSVTDETDLNYETSCRYFIRKDGEFLIAELSLVAPYAVVLDTNAISPVHIITAKTARSRLAREVLNLLHKHGVTVLDTEILQTPISMPFTNVEEGEETFYQALIADTPAPFQT